MARIWAPNRSPGNEQKQDGYYYENISALRFDSGAHRDGVELVSPSAKWRRCGEMAPDTSPPLVAIMDTS